MKNQYRIAIILSVLVVAALACATLSRGEDPGETNGTNGSGGTGGTVNQPNTLFEDDFSDTGSGWDRYSDEFAFTDYESGAYKVGVYTTTYFAWASPYQNFNDVIVEVQAQKVTGEDAAQIGIVCKHLDIDNFYALVISADGYAAVRKRYQGGELEFLTDWQEVTAINLGNATNSLRAECVGSSLALYVNGALAVQTNDTDITSGDTGVLAGTLDEQTSVEVLFDNFVVRQP